MLSFHAIHIASVSFLLAGVSPALAQNRDDAWEQPAGAIRRAESQRFVGTMLIRVETPSPRVPRQSDTGADVYYDRITVAESGGLRIDRFNMSEPPGADATPQATVVVSAAGMWRMTPRGSGRSYQLDFVRSPNEVIREKFDGVRGMISTKVGQEYVELFVRQRAGEMAEWRPWTIARQDDVLKSQHLSGPAFPRTIQSVAWHGKNGNWFVGRITRTGENLPVFSQEFDGYARHESAWMPSRITEWQQPDGPSRELSIIETVGPVPSGIFIPPVAENSEVDQIIQLQELSETGWSAMSLTIRENNPVIYGHDLFAYEGTASDMEFTLGSSSEPPILRNLRAFADEIKNSTKNSGD